MSGYGRALAGFVAGAADYGVDRIKARETLDMELKKTKLLADLQKETEKEMAVFRDNLEKKGFNKELSSIDYTTGERIMRDGNGNEIGRTKLSESDMEAYKLDKQKAELDIKDKESTINSRAHDDRIADERLGLDRISTGASVESSRASANLSRKQAAALDGGTRAGAGDADEAAAAELLYQQKDLVSQARSSGMMQADIEDLAKNVVKESKSTAEAKQRLRDMIRIQMRFAIADKKAGLGG